MSRVTYHPGSPYVRMLRNWSPTLGIWGVGAGGYVLYLLSSTPLVKKNFLVNVPLLGSYFADKTPDCDKPF